MLKDEDWFLYSIWEMSDYKISLNDLENNLPYGTILKIREYLMIGRTKEEAYRRDAKLNEGG